MLLEVELYNSNVLALWTMTREEERIKEMREREEGKAKQRKENRCTPSTQNGLSAAKVPGLFSLILPAVGFLPEKGRCLFLKWQLLRVHEVIQRVDRPQRRLPLQRLTAVNRDDPSQQMSSQEAIEPVYYFQNDRWTRYTSALQVGLAPTSGSLTCNVDQQEDCKHTTQLHCKQLKSAVSSKIPRFCRWWRAFFTARS